MRFDAYAGNVWERPAEEVANVIAWSLKGRVERAKPRGRYAQCFEVKDAAASVGWVGRDDRLGSAYFEFKGGRTPDVSASIRKHWTEGHNVSRCDVCDDYNQAGAFGRLVDICDQVKGDRRVTSHAIVPRDGDRGQTVYYGSGTSQAMVRVYEKGKQAENLHLAKPDWARIELQVRPGKAALKELSARLDPLALWGLARWTANIAQTLTGLDLERFRPPQEAPQYDRTTLYLARTFRRHWEEMKADLGDWECIGREIEAIWAEDDQAQESGRGMGAA